LKFINICPIQVPKLADFRSISADEEENKENHPPHNFVHQA
jgi:hypothetical protein